MANLASISFSPLSSPSSKNPRGNSSLSSPFHRHPLSLPLSSPFSTSAVSSHLVSSTKVHPFGLSARPNGSVTMVRAEAVGRVGVSTKNVLIVNTNGGGHAIIGFYLAKELLELGHAVTILTVGDEASDKMKKPPFSRFSEIVDAGGRTIWGDPADVAKVVGEASFDVVLENNGKDIDTVRPVADWANNTGVEQFLYISSAGIYKPVDELPHVEGDIVKDDASHVAVEKYISGLSFKSWSVFRPQYMIGSGNNKDCEEWFFDRIARDKPVPIPGSGMQVTSISHVRDLSSMLALAIEKPTEACGNIFNCVVDRAVTFDGLAKMCAQAAGREVKIVHYDPKVVGVDAKKAFPFRNMHFYAEPRTAKLVLGWSSTTNLPEDLKERFEEYVSIGRDKQAMKFDVDEKILESLKMAISP